MVNIKRHAPTTKTSALMLRLRAKENCRFKADSGRIVFLCGSEAAATIMLGHVPSSN
ncbi:hypothetical protein [Lysinibacillus sp. JNUCC 51]|uniref:hypothetical protein n=1 Tax=Lysinibacillus sp. JNUCC-51 TaxID=2792479 RepID=UPI0019380535|nr:hypothetical protein JNUCC51_22525 [Lysinibacillus sp. JNUCC-51]